MNLFKKVTGLGAAGVLALGLAACGSDNASSDSDSVGKTVNYKITGIDPGAGIMQATEDAIKEYELDDWELVSGSGAAMTASLKKAYDKEKPIILTGWNPHWMFSKYDLKYLDDPKGVYGGAEEIHSIGRLGLKDDHPEAYKALQQFKWEDQDMGAIMVEIQDGEKPEVAAQNWINENEEKVKEWTKDVNKVDGDKLKLVYVSWDSNIASINVMKIVLEDLGYNVTISQVEAGPMWTAVADGSADALLAGWLPVTHQTYAEKFDGKFEDLGISMENVKIGLTVPTYMDIDSIEDLKN
ncbi:glycine/betaine ABC transporter [Bacillus sp. FJAT-49711]|uniref:glycine betaine ABC transporter substrate-binding protein n=1 Tax=Bacillus sp. FJAT-49711 TaxID=2833585 RepID=UPI001BC9D23E|nr:glycine betaine ABC transporter substrate-binding protein [Bacillus sp. FJAT-49711]MBS4220565.1 glycine/betaine ABC transporter [Bacillus sp. FJAT-49711]